MILVNGDLLSTPINIIAHQVNCMSVMGAGLALQIKNKFEWVYQDYCESLHRNGADYMFGKSQITIGEEHTIFNIFGQYGYGHDKQYTDYDKFKSAFVDAITSYRHYLHIENEVQLTIAIPYMIGCGLAGGAWSEIKTILEEIEKEYNVVFIAYKL